MQAEMLAIALRMAERMVAVLAGGMAVLLGYRLFLALPLIDSGGGKLTLPGGTAIYVSRVGPGVFFALFGAGLLAWVVHNQINVPLPSPTSGAVAESAVRPAFVGAFATDVATQVQVDPDKQRTIVVDRVRTLAQFQRAVEENTLATMSATDRADLSRVLAQARVQLLHDVWDEASWGSFGAFESWILDGERQPPPSRVVKAAGIYRGMP